MKKNDNYKKPSQSETIKTEVVCPNDTNPMGILKGGRLVEWMDMAAAVCAQTHSGKICVTVSIDDVDFNEAANVGDIITIKAKITKAFNTSMEIFVQAFARKVLAEKKYLISEAYFTFVALDEKGKAAQVIAVRPVTESEKKQYDAAERKKKMGRLKEK
jgi:acyl-CoA hydrolase